ncbi:hypothetical protein OH77DRAFT_1247792 [Trametes cingulata]|nr:hypothetical protein OH77DRAFT_1247792 [Trametes cingulata]
MSRTNPRTSQQFRFMARPAIAPRESGIVLSRSSVHASSTRAAAAPAFPHAKADDVIRRSSACRPCSVCVARAAELRPWSPWPELELELNARSARAHRGASCSQKRDVVPGLAGCEARGACYLHRRRPVVSRCAASLASHPLEGSPGTWPSADFAGRASSSSTAVVRVPPIRPPSGRTSSAKCTLRPAKRPVGANMPLCVRICTPRVLRGLADANAAAPRRACGPPRPVLMSARARGSCGQRAPPEVGASWAWPDVLARYPVA